MAVRPIDANELYRIEKLLDTDIVRQDKVALNLLEQVLYDIQHVPTLTPPNEGAKGKNVPANGPLTLEEIRLMIEPTPVWWDWVQGWVLARKGIIISWNGVYYNFGEVKGNFYRRPPEEEEEENDVIEITENL